MTRDEFHRLVPGFEWREAVSYRDTMPHEWARPHPGNFGRTRAFIRDNANSLTLNGHQAYADRAVQYWAIWPVINRVGWCHEHLRPDYQCDH